MIVCFKDPAYVLMRVLLCKIQCPSFMCLSKPSSHIYTSGSLKLENTLQVEEEIVDHDHDTNDYDDAHVEVEIVDHVNGLLNEVGEEDCSVEETIQEEEGHYNGGILKSCLRNVDLDSTDGGRKEKKKVQWVDLIGKELVEIREFVCSEEEEDFRYDGYQSCVCVIL